MAAEIKPKDIFNDALLNKVAKALAMDIKTPEDIARDNSISISELGEMLDNGYFQEVYKAEKTAWNSVEGTADRIKIKSLTMIEEVLPEMFARINDKNESLLHKNDTIKTIAKFAGVGGDNSNMKPEKFSVVINLGPDKAVSIEATQAPVQSDPVDDIDYKELTSAD